MKKFIMVVMALVIAVSAYAETIDENIIDMSVGGILLDGADVLVTLYPGYEVNQYGNHGEPWNYIDALGEIENNSDETIILSGGTISINGWQTECAVNDLNWGWACVEPHLKMKLRFTFDLYNAGISAVDEITDFSVTFKVEPYGSVETLFESEPVKLIP